MAEEVLRMRDITKIFPGVKALDGVNFELNRGEIHALMGENGAGKSTFIKVITGVHEPDVGEIILHGERVVFKNPKDAENHSIAAIYQHGTIYPHLSITENIFIGHEEIQGPLKTINWKQLHKEASRLLEELSCDLNPRTLVSELTVAEQQIVEIAKAISTKAEIIIMDEPTASLSRRECEELYRITEKLRDEGVSIIFISHRFEDMYRLASRVSVLRDGKYIGTWQVDEISNADLIRAMVGRDIEHVYPQKECPIGEVVMEAKNLKRVGYFQNVSFNVCKGEILGFSGLVGAGRTEVMQGIFGVEKLSGGEVYLEGKKCEIHKPQDAMDYGIGLLPEDRQKQGLVLDWEIYKNITLATLSKYKKSTILKPKEERASAKNLGLKLALKAPTVFEKASSLSGGNQQKVVFCKLMDSDLKVLILDEPTKGVDVGAKSQIYGIMNELAAQGYAIIMVSSDMPEIIGMCDRVIVMHEGKVAGEFDRSEISQELLLQASMGLGAKEVAVHE